MASPNTPPNRLIRNFRNFGQPRRLIFDPIQVAEIDSTIPEEEEEEEEQVEEEVPSDEDLFDEEPPSPSARVRAMFLRVVPPMIWEESNIMTLRMWLRWYEPDSQPENWVEIAYFSYLARSIRSRLQTLGVDPDGPLLPNAPAPPNPPDNV